MDKKKEKFKNVSYREIIKCRKLTEFSEQDKP